MHFTALQTNIYIYTAFRCFCSRDTWRVKFACQVQSPCRAMRMSLCPSIWRSRWAWRCIWHVTPNPERATHNQAVIEHLLHQKQGMLGWKLKGEKKGLDQQISMDKKSCTSWDGCKKWKHCDYSYHVYDIWTFMISAAAGILFINLPPRVPQHFDASTVSSSSHFSACWVFVACFFAISSNIIIINVQFAKAFIVRQTMTQFQHLSTRCRSKVWISHPCQANHSPSKIPSVAMI